jgi:hypothetical protein
MARRRRRMFSLGMQPLRIERSRAAGGSRAPASGKPFGLLVEHQLSSTLIKVRDYDSTTAGQNRDDPCKARRVSTFDDFGAVEHVDVERDASRSGVGALGGTRRSIFHESSFWDSLRHSTRAPCRSQSHLMTSVGADSADAGAGATHFSPEALAVPSRDVRTGRQLFSVCCLSSACLTRGAAYLARRRADEHFFRQESVQGRCVESALGEPPKEHDAGF